MGWIILISLNCLKFEYCDDCYSMVSKAFGMPMLLHAIRYPGSPTTFLYSKVSLRWNLYLYTASWHHLAFASGKAWVTALITSCSFLTSWWLSKMYHRCQWDLNRKKKNGWQFCCHHPCALTYDHTIQH